MEIKYLVWSYLNFEWWRLEKMVKMGEVTEAEAGWMIWRRDRG